ncbi:MAG: hypothetical protein ACXABY_01430 [Candidatus Thorarchaeota archaeon]|jgi:hypothetical protein
MRELTLVCGTALCLFAETSGVAIFGISLALVAVGHWIGSSVAGNHRRNKLEQHVDSVWAQITALIERQDELTKLVETVAGRLVANSQSEEVPRERAMKKSFEIAYGQQPTKQDEEAAHHPV